MIQRFLFALLGIVAILVIISKTDVYGAEAEGIGYHYYGPDISKNHSCKFAQLKAEEDAVIKATGETVSAQDWKVCSDPECVLKEYRWTALNGLILYSEIKSQEITQLFGQDVCEVRIVAEVMPIEKDPSFNATIELRTNMYNIGYHLLINIDPSQKMYVYVFSWNDAELDQVNVHKVFPNSYETELIKNETVIPNSNYELITTYPSNYTGDWLDEYLYVIMSKRKLKFSNGYKFDQFNQLLLRLDPYDTNVEIIGITIAK